MARLRILVSSFSLSPYQGSEPGIGWNIASRLARYHDVTVLYGGVEASHLSEKDVERYFKDHAPIAGLKLCYIAPTAFMKWIEALHRLPFARMSYYLAYNLWQRQAFRKAAELHRERPFELIHHLTITGYREPGYLWKLPAPFVWGPIAGGSDVPWSFVRSLGWRYRVTFALRNFFNHIQKRFAWRPRHAAQKAARIWAVTADDVQMARRYWHRSARMMADTGTQRPDGVDARQWDTGPLELVFSGVHEPRKMLPVVLHAMAQLPDPSRVRLSVLGEGPETRSWRALAQRLGVMDRVSWLGRVSRDKALGVMNLAHVCMFPSIKEGTSMVVVESLTLGLPVVCHDVCGMAAAINAGCGIKVPLVDFSTSVTGFRDAMMRFIAEPGLVQDLSKGALERAKVLTWDIKAQQLAEEFSEVCAQSRQPV